MNMYKKEIKKVSDSFCSKEKKVLDLHLDVSEKVSLNHWNVNPADRADRLFGWGSNFEALTKVQLGFSFWISSCDSFQS